MSYTGTVQGDLNILHDILQDATGKVYHEWDIPFIKAKIASLGDIVASTRDRPILQLTHRQRRLLWEMCTAQDVDTLNENLARIGEEDTGRHELRAIEDLLDPDEQFQQEWVNRYQ